MLYIPFVPDQAFRQLFLLPRRSGHSSPSSSTDPLLHEVILRNSYSVFLLPHISSVVFFYRHPRSIQAYGIDNSQPDIKPSSAACTHVLRPIYADPNHVFSWPGFLSLFTVQSCISCLSHLVVRSLSSIWATFSGHGLQKPPRRFHPVCSKPFFTVPHGHSTNVHGYLKRNATASSASSTLWAPWSLPGPSMMHAPR